MELRRLIPFLDNSVSKWAVEARLLHWLTLLWLFIGLVILFSASYPEALNNSNFNNDGLYYFKRQLLWILFGLIGFSAVIHSSLQNVLKISHWGVLLVLVLIWMLRVPGIGIEEFGSIRRMGIGIIQLQPSELIKPFLVLQSARLFGNWNRFSWGSRLTWLCIFVLVLLGILIQPNLSTTALCGITIWLIALAAGLPYKHLLGTAFSGLFLAVVSLKDYQIKRILSFLNPWADPRGDSYQLVQSLLAVGSGGISGSGFGLSQQKLDYLPIQTTDFIFSVFAEEFGFIGSLLFLLMLVVYATLALIVATKATNIVHRLVAIGSMILLVGQSLLNIGVATGALPTTGLPLPLVSYGGNSIIASLIAAGLLIRVARESSEADVVYMRRKQRIVER